MENNAYITFLSTDNYIYYILGLFDSWKKTESKYPLYCCVTETVSDIALGYLDKIGLSYIKVNTADFKKLAEQSKKLGMKENYVNATTKLAIFNLTQFKKCVYLDSDFWIQKNIDDLFDKPNMAAVEDCAPEPHEEHKHYALGMSLFCAGMFVFEPNCNFYEKLISQVYELPKNIKWNDQNLLAYNYKNWATNKDLILDPSYLVNISPEVFYHYNKNYVYDDIKIKHYVRHKHAPFTDFEYIPENIFNEYFMYFKYLNSLVDSYGINIQKADLSKLKCAELPVNKKYLINAEKIDLVVPYVDCEDANWQKTFLKYRGPVISEGTNATNRFRGQGNFFRFFFRCIENNLKFINNIYLLVSDDSQVPSWLNRTKVKIVTHERFIPARYLPTFNSCTIEMFLNNIPGLSEKFIYLNDDFFVLKTINKADLFSAAGAKINFLTNFGSGIYYDQCRNSYKLIFGKESFKRCGHELRPYFKSKIEECFYKYNKQILESISMFRANKNFNCYIYSLYLDSIGLISKSSIKSGYIQNFDVNALNNSDTICINDTNPNKNIYEDENLISYFATKFPNKSKYELNDYKFKIVKQKPQVQNKQKKEERTFTSKKGYYLAF